MENEDPQSLVKKWLDHLEGNLQVMAESWSKLAEPVDRIGKLLAGVRDGDSFKMTKEFLELVERLQGEIGRCPVIQDGPVAPSCRPLGPFSPTDPFPPKGGPGKR